MRVSETHSEPSQQPAPRTLLEHALAYARLGWYVIPCRGKLPLVEHGSHDGSVDPAQIHAWWNKWPSANIGIVCGPHSGIWALDIDPRNGGDVSAEQLVERHGALPDTAMALTGNNGTHHVFRWPVDGKVPMKPGHGIDVIGRFRYFLAEPSIHPQTGRVYAWEGSCDPLEGQAIAQAPNWLLDVERPSPKAATIPATGYLAPQRIAELRSALQRLDPDDYHRWIAVGQALHASAAPEAFELWDTWSQRGSKYKTGETQRKWDGFKPSGGLNVESVFAWAYEAGWEHESLPATLPAVPAESVRARQAESLDVEPPPPDLLSVPGALGALVDYANRTAPKPQPLFAVTAALAFAAAVTARRWTTDLGTWSPLYFCNVGKSASGKEHARTVIERALSASRMDRLLGPAGYTSDAAVFSALMQQPAHLTIIDELGEYLAAAKAEGNFHRRQAMTMLMECWGRAGGTLRPQGYSTASLPRNVAADMAKRRVERPGLCLLGMTTPQTFYDALDDSAVRNGFLNRLIVLETHIGRQGYGQFEAADVPDSIIAWAEAARTACAGNLADIDVAADMIPAARTIPILPAARRAWMAYQSECLASMDSLEESGLAELEGRSAEKAMRLSLLLAVSRNAESPAISEDDVAWSRTLVRFATRQTIEACRRRMHATQFGAVKETVYESILRGGQRGKSERELCKSSRPFAGMDVRERLRTLAALEHEGRIAKTTSKAVRGPERIAWVAVTDDSESVN